MDPLDIGKFEQLKATGELPSPKGPALAIIRLTQKEGASLADLAQAIKPDPAFVGRLIKAANSARFSPARPIVSIQNALALLGLPAVRSLALAFSLISDYRSGRCRNFDYQRFWSHSVVCAAALQALTLRTGAAPAEEAFSVGLLARVGSLAMATMFPDQYSALLGQLSSGNGTRLSELERCTFVMTHSELTTAMLLDWGLPKIFAESTLYHEFPDQAPFAEGSRRHALVWSLSLAQGIADACLAPESERRAIMPRLFILGSKLSLGADEVNVLCNKVVQEWLEWGGMLGLPTESLPPFEDLSQVSRMNGNGTDGDKDSRGLRVLVVDDDPAIRTVLRTLLAKAGHEVFEAANGQQGLEMAIEVAPQLMILDWIMPEMDGLEVTRALRQTKIGRSIYVLVLTSLEDDEDLIKAFEAGIDDFMSKPLRSRVLAARLRAGQRVVRLQEEIERDREDIRRFATELALTNSRLQEAAMTDFLTGFPNRRYAMERIEQEWAAATRSNRPLACLIIDLDEFKRINDAHGHDVGDVVLRQASMALKRGLRAHDVVSRTGGDEFLVICPDTTLKAATACAERVRKSVASTTVVAGNVELHPSISVGVAVRDESMPVVDALIKCADRSLYLAKERGRNRIGALQVPLQQSMGD
jgi:two-component system, cell cycle response regulator